MKNIKLEWEKHSVYPVDNVDDASLREFDFVTGWQTALLTMARMVYESEDYQGSILKLTEELETYCLMKIGSCDCDRHH